MTVAGVLKPRGLDAKREAELKAQAAAYAEPLSETDQAEVAQLRAKLARREGRRGAKAKGGAKQRGVSDAGLMQQLGIDRLEEEFRAAVDCMRRLPGAVGGSGSSWPAMLQDVWSIHDVEEAQARLLRTRPAVPTAQEISRMDRCFGWLTLLGSDHERRIVLARAKGMGYRSIANDVVKGCNKDTVRADYLGALVRLFQLLTESGIIL